MNIQKFEGWLIICPHCGHKEYISEEDIAFDPMLDEVHVIKCEKCGKEFEVYYD